ncbi:MAG: hypothetical protein KDD18_13375 [Mangrovimonas sp.]|nr:hypothetical protein [Mangrovimonas sp.]MCB0433926.1 hypothetical protein [Mangrovimonas sp.]
MKTISYTLTLALILSFGSLHAQKKSKQKDKDLEVTVEEIQSQCEHVPQSERVTVSVSSFKVATPSAYAKFGDELSQMLTNALQNVNCFNVLLSTKDSNEILNEIEFGETGNTQKGATPKRGKMKGAQVIVMGKVTEYAAGQSSQSYGPVKIANNKAHIGFIIQLINVETRELIDSKSFNVDGSAGGFKGVKVGGVRMAGSIQDNKALANACEKGIIEAIEYIVSSKDKMPLPDANNVNAKDGTYITILNADYSKVKTVAELLSSKGKVSNKEIVDGTGSFFLEHSMKTDAIADLIDSKLGNKYSIQSLEEGEITLVAK